MEEKFFDLQRFGVISNSTANTLISGTGGNDSIKNDSSGDNVTIKAGTGNDTIINYGWGSSTLGNNSGNDDYDDYDDYYDDEDDYYDDDYYYDDYDYYDVTETGNQRNKFVIIDSGDGNDKITNYGRKVSINAGSGNNYIYNESYGSRSYRINGSYDSSQDHDSYSEYSSYCQYYQYGGYHVSIKSGEGDDTIYKNGGSNVKIDAGAGSNYVSLYSGWNVDVNTGTGDDTIKGYNTSSGTINAGDGNNIVSVYSGSSINIVSGTGDDSIYNRSSNTTINSGAGDDTINNDYSYSSLTAINGGAGNDSIYNEGNNVTIDGGAGHDTIRSSGEGVLFIYSKGDGNDVIYGMSATDTLQICGGTYTTTASGDDIIVTVGDGQITIVGGVNVGAYVEEEKPAWRINNTTATYGTMNNPSVTVIGVKSKDGLSINGTVVTVGEAALNQSNVAISNGYLLTLASGVSAPKVTPAHWEFDDSNKKAIYKSDKTDAGYSIVNGQIVYTKESGGKDLITVTGVKSKDGLMLNGNTVTVTNSVLNQEKVTISDGYTLALASDVETPTKLEAHFDGNAYKSESNTAGYSVAADRKSITHTGTKQSETLFTLTGANITNAITVDTSNKTVKLTAANLKQETVMISDGSYELILADDVPKPQTTAEGWTHSGSTATYKNSSISAGYSVNNNYISYNTASGGETVVTVDGVKSKDGLSLNNQTVTVGAAALNQTAVTVSNGYYLNLADDVTKSTTIAAGWTLTNDVAAYKNAATSTGYSVVNNQIIYNNAGGGNTLVTVTGVRSKEGLNLDGTTVTVSNSALNQSAVTISNGYTLALADDVQKSTTTAAGWYGNGYNSGAVYKTEATSEGYQLVGNQIVYKTASGGADLITVEGVQSTSGLSLNGTTVTVAANALSQWNEVTISNGYNLALANDVQKSATTAAGWTFAGTTASYKNATISAGYKLANNRITYNYASGGDTLTKVNGVKSKDGLSINGTTVTVGAKALGKSNVTIDSGYGLALGNDVVKSNTTAEGWTLKGTTATYKNAATSEGYKLVNNEIVYKQKSGGGTLVTVTGVKSLDGLSLNDKVVTIKASALNKAKVTVSGSGYTLKLDDNVVNSKTTKAWAFNKGKKTATYAQTTTAGYKLAGDGKSVTYSNKATKNLVTVSGVKSSSGLSIKDKVVTIAKAALGTDKVTVSDGYTLSLHKNVPTPKTTKTWSYKNSTATYAQTTVAGYTLAGNGKSISYTKAATAKALATVQGAKSAKGLTVSGNTITLKNSALKNQVTVGGSYEFNFASDYKKATITGSKNADTITANGNNLLINGGAGNDTIKFFGTSTTVKGGAGKDVFVYKSGNNVIADYAPEDTIQITSGKAKVAKSGSDVIFTVGKNKITVTGGKSKKISYVDAGGKHSYFAAASEVTISGKTVKLLEDYSEDTFNVANYGEKLQMIDGTSVQRDISIAGNELMNSIIGGKGNDTLIGGKSNDTLTGGEGSDVFVYANGDGNDLITDYKEEDTIKITSGKVTKFKKSGNDVIFTVGKGNISIKGGANKVISYVDSSGEHSYPETVKFNANGTAATILSSYVKDDFDLANYDDYKDTVKNINGSAVVHDIVITGNKLMNSISGGDGNDTLIGGKSNDTLTGGDGSDVFVYNNGDGNDVITDYADEDKIKIASGTAKVLKSGKDVIFTVGSGKITVKGAASKTVTYVDAGGKINYYPTTPTENVILTDSNTKAILRETYGKNTFIASDYNAAIKTIDASAVTHGISITGNGKANVILGSYENDTINGNKGNDTLQGGSGADTFLYANGDGNDFILDYAEEDTIKITKGNAKITKSGDNVIFTVGSGKMTVANAAGKTISYIDANGAKKTYSSAPLFMADDTDYELTPNNLSALVQSKSVDYSFINTSTKLSKETNLITYSGSKK